MRNRITWSAVLPKVLLRLWLNVQLQQNPCDSLR